MKPRTPQKFLFPILILAVCITQFASDIYAPCMPAMAKFFGVPIGSIQWTMSIYMFGVALTHLIAGPLSEAFGRKRPMVIGLMIMLGGTLLCTTATSFPMLFLGRFIQGCGAGACACLWRAIFRDVYTKEELSQRASHLVMFIMFVTPSAPVLGGYLQTFFGWRSNFSFMLLYTLVAILGMVFLFRETNTQQNKDHLKVRHIASTYGILLKSPLFMGITIGTLLSYGAFFSWFVVSPVLLIEGLGVLPTTFGWLTFCAGLGALFSASYCNGRFVKVFGVTTMLRFGWSVMLFAGIFMATCHVCNIFTIWSVMIPMFLFYFGSNFIWPNAFATAFTPFGNIAGYAGALYGFLQISGGGIVSGIVSYLPDSQWEFSITLILSTIAAWGVYELCAKKHTLTPTRS